jgi:hypothetical protein
VFYVYIEDAGPPAVRPAGRGAFGLGHPHQVWWLVAVAGPPAPPIPHVHECTCTQNPWLLAGPGELRVALRVPAAGCRFSNSNANTSASTSTACPPAPSPSLSPFDPVFCPMRICVAMSAPFGDFLRGVLALASVSPAALWRRRCRLWVAFPNSPRFGLWRSLALIRYNILYILRCALAAASIADARALHVHCCCAN